MTINMEVKKDGLNQAQDGTWKLRLTIHPNDMPVDLMTAYMGQRYALAMIPIEDEQSANSDVYKPIKEPTEGERLRTRAVLLCKEKMFQDFTNHFNQAGWGENKAKEYILNYCKIKSRSEIATDTEAQSSFYALDCLYKEWLFEQQYADNLGRV